MPTACAAMPMRPASSKAIAILKPPPGAPSTAVLGILASAKCSSRVSEARRPIFFSFFPTVKPCWPFSTKRHVMPREPASLLVETNTTNVEAKPPLVTHDLVPLTR